ncbi:hypothetical protein Droror1_Dr00013553 [Drosera rotundifolia]
MDWIERVMKYEADDSGTLKIEKKNEQMRREVILRGVLSVTVVSAEGLPALDFLGKSNPYVVIMMKKLGTKVKTRVLHDTLNPVWNQTFDFVVEDALHELLILEVYVTTLLERVSNLIGGKFVDSHSSEEIDVGNLRRKRLSVDGDEGRRSGGDGKSRRNEQCGFEGDVGGSGHAVLEQAGEAVEDSEIRSRARASDIIFLIYVYQRWIYPVDHKRVTEFGFGGEDEDEASTSSDGTVANIDDKKTN